MNQPILIAAAVVLDHAGRMLGVKKRGTIEFMRPGGKIDAGKTARRRLDVSSTTGLSATARVALLGALAALASPAIAADTLPITGVYGNAEGCKLHKDGTVDNDTLLLLKPDWVQSYGTGCDILQVLPGKDGAFLITGICHFEGEDTIAPGAMVITPVPDDKAALRIHGEDGTVWGDVKPCP